MDDPRMDALALYRIDMNAGRAPDGKGVVLVTITSPGVGLTVALATDQVEEFVSELRRIASLAKSGLHVAGPGQIPPVNGKGH